MRTSTKPPAAPILAAWALLACQAFAAPAAPQGFITGKVFLNIAGTAVADLTGDPRFPDNPDAYYYPPYFEWNPAADILTPANNAFADNYGAQMLGYFYPPSTGDYVFWLSADDGAVLYLSTDATAANKKLIAEEAGWSNPRNWETIGGGSVVSNKNSQTFGATQWETKDPVNGGAKITLTANEPYYIEALVKEGGGGDNLAVAVQDPLGAIDPLLPIPGEYLATIDKTTGPVSIVTQPVSQSVAEGTPVSFSVVADGTPPYTYQWRRDGQPIDGETNLTYSIAFVQSADDGAVFSVVVTGGEGNVTSADATLTVSIDAIAPTLVRATGGGDYVTVTVEFSERVDPTSATATGNYSISGGVTVTGVEMVNDTTVQLTTSQQTAGTVYTLTVSNVADLATTPNVIAAGSTININTAVFKTGLVQWERWDGGGAIDALVTAIEDGTIGPPDVTWNTTLFESGRDLGNEYRARGYTWFTPPQDGDYKFIITADDNARLFLSTDDDPANKVLIAGESTWSNNREWAAATEEQNSAISTLGLWPTFEITLQASQTYYLEALWQEGGGGDGCEVTWALFNDPLPANGTLSALSGEQIGVFVDPTTLPPVFSLPAGNSAVTVDAGASQTLTVVADGATSYQWQLNGVDIPGATSADYVIASADPTDSGQYWAFAVNDNGSVRSPLINVLVTATGVFNIEAEDFDYDGGQTMAEASAMPYLGGAYEGLSAIHGVDYLSAEDLSAPDSGWTAVYRTGAPITPTTTAPMENQVPGGQFAITRMGEWEMTANYKIGWISAGDWGNYTRTFPTPAQSYWVFAGSSFDGTGANQVSGSVGLVTAGKGTPTQTVEILGNFSGPGTGGWSRNNLLALTDDAGGITTVEIGGENTIRWNYSSGDVDYLVFVPATAGPDEVVITGVIREGDSVTVTWTGGGEAEVTDDLNGTWTPTGDTDGSFTAPIQPGNAFLRIRKDE